MEISEHSGASRPAGAAVPTLERGQRVFLDGSPDGPWRTTVTGRTGRLVALAPPGDSGGAPVSMVPGEGLRIEYVVGDVPFEAEAEIVAIPAAGGHGVYVARLTGEPSRMQRRGAIRVPVRLVVTASLGEGGGAETIGAVTDNLSAGGALLRTPRALEPGRTVRLLVASGGATGTLELAGRCVRCDRLTDGARPWRVAITFQDLAPAAEDRLARMLFAREHGPRSPASA